MGKQKSQQADINLPELDKVEYLEDELLYSRLSLIRVGYAIGLALLTMVMAGILRSTWAGVLVFFLGLGGSYYLVKYVARIPMEKMPRKKWVGHAMALFFVWLGFSVLLINPPFADISPPAVLEVWVMDSSGQLFERDCLDRHEGDQVFEPAAGSLDIAAWVTDNDEIKLVNIIIYQRSDPDDPSSLEVIEDNTMTSGRGADFDRSDADGDPYSFQYGLSPGDYYKIWIVAEDVNDVEGDSLTDCGVLLDLR